MIFSNIFLIARTSNPILGTMKRNIVHYAFSFSFCMDDPKNINFSVKKSKK